jgi:cyanophycin synthetase
MGQAGDLLLIFADSLVRSWKQITKFKSASVAAAVPAAAPAPAFLGNGSGTDDRGRGEPPAQPFSLEGLIRDERGVRYAPEAED